MAQKDGCNVSLSAENMLKQYLRCELIFDKLHMEYAQNRGWRERSPGEKW